MTTHHHHHHHHHHLIAWFMVILALLQRVQGDQSLAEDCHEYCLKCPANTRNNRTPNVHLGDALQVSLQVMANRMLPFTQIVLQGASNETYIIIDGEEVTVRYGDEIKHLNLTSPLAAFSWRTIVLDPAGPDTLHVYTPMDKLNVITVNTNHSHLAFVSSKNETHVTFNCLSGCLIRNSSSALVGAKVKLQPPFTMYLNPRSRPPQAPMRLSITPVLTLTSDKDLNTTLNASHWTPDMWYRVEVLEGEKQKVEEPQEGRDGVMEVQLWVAKGTYTPTKLRGFRWTLHCPPKGIIPDPRNDTDGEASASTPLPDSGEGTEAAGEGSKGNKPKGKSGGAGAGTVTAWVMAGLALFLVMVLALALCTKTASPSHTNQFHDSQPSVGIVYCRGAGREPEEDSEPESPHELKVPSYRNSHKHFGKDFKGVEG